MGGVLFVQNSFADKDKVKIAVKITDCVSDSISVGIGDPDAMRSKGFKIDGICSQDLESDFSGLFGLCSMGFVFNDFDSPSFVFSTGDIIEVEWDVTDIRISFRRRNGIEKYEIYPPISP